MPGIIGTIQATETIKLIAGGGESLVNRLLLFDAWTMRFREVRLSKNPDCPMCGAHPTIKGLIDHEAFCGITTAAVTTPSNQREELSAVELKQWIDSGRDLQLIDVREPHEHEFARIPKTTLIPLGQLADRMAEIDPARETVVYCRSGARSAHAIRHLRQAGFAGRLLNLKGGILAWSKDVDPSVPRY